MQAEISRSGAPRAPTAPRGGRPKAEQAGEVERRILDAASELFLRLGFEAASLDRVAIEARAGKASLYARYANKEALFAAVVHDCVARIVGSSRQIPSGLKLHERMQAVAQALVLHTLRPESIAFMRMVFTTAHRLPHLAQLAFGSGRAEGTRCIAEAITGGSDGSAEEQARAGMVAGRLLDMTLVPLQMRALVGEDLTVLEGEVAPRVAEAIALLSGAGWLKSWA